MLRILYFTDWTGLDLKNADCSKTWTCKTHKKVTLLTRSSTIRRTSQVKIRGIITLNINVYNTNKSTNKIHNLI